MCRLLITVAYPEELDIVAKFSNRIKILDLKNVKCEESLGAPSIRLIRYALSRKFCEISVPIGDITSYISCIISYVELLDSLDIDYIKMGIAIRDLDTILRLLRDVRNILTSTKLVVTCFGDMLNNYLFNVNEIIDICRKYDCDVFMLDTKSKRNGSILNYVDISTLLSIRNMCHNYGLKFSIAGKLSIDDVQVLLREVKPDIIGVRSCICDSGRNGKISVEKLERLIRIFT